MKPTAAFGCNDGGDAEPPARERIWQVVSQIPPGRVASYGQVASLAGLPNGARQVGRILGQLPEGGNLPWHRVITASGKIAFPPGTEAFREQRTRLIEEGVACPKGKVSMPRYRWEP